MKVENPIPPIATGAAVGLVAFGALELAKTVLSVATLTAIGTAMSPFLLWGALLGFGAWGIGAAVKFLTSHPAQPPKAA